MVQNSLLTEVWNGIGAWVKKFKPDTEDIKYFFQTSWKLVKSNPDLRKPIYTLWMLHIFFCIIFTVYVIVTGWYFLKGSNSIDSTTAESLMSSIWEIIIPVWLPGLIFILLWLIVFAFVKTSLQWKFSLMAYRIMEESSYSEASISDEIKTIRHRLREITWMSLLESLIQTVFRWKWWIFTLLVSFFLSTVSEVWDLMRNYLIPAVVIEKKWTWTETADSFRALEQNVPATLVWVFGIDFGEKVFGWLFWILKFLNFLFWAFLSYIFFVYLSGRLLFDFHLSFSVVAVFVLFPILFSIFLNITITGIKRLSFEMLKTLYFTCLYTAANHPEVLEKNQGLKEYLTFDWKY